MPKFKFMKQILPLIIKPIVNISYNKIYDGLLDAMALWGKGAIDSISRLLQEELPGLRGFSVSNIKNMRLFYEEWSEVINRQPAAGELEKQTTIVNIGIDENLLLKEIGESKADEFEWSNFFAISFSHHLEILSKAKTLDARLFYIHESAIRFWNKYTLRDYLKADLYSHRGLLPNNFTLSIPNPNQALKHHI